MPKTSITELLVEHFGKIIKCIPTSLKHEYSINLEILLLKCTIFVTSIAYCDKKHFYVTPSLPHIKGFNNKFSD